MCFRDACSNATNLVESKQPALAIHLLQIILASPTPVSAGEEEASAGGRSEC